MMLVVSQSGGLHGTFMILNKKKTSIGKGEKPDGGLVQFIPVSK